MKIFNKILIISFLSLGLLSCEDKLEEVPYDVYDSELAFQTEGDLVNGIRGVYYTLLNAGYYGSSDAGSMLSFPDVLADNVIMTSRGRFTKRTLHEWNYSQDLITDGFYSDCYRVIGLANNLLERIDAINYNGSLKADLQAEARALRGMAHFDLVRTYGKIPTQSADANSSLGVPYVFSSTVLENMFITPNRETVQRTYQLIEEDLLFAYNNISGTARIGRLHKAGVALLLSRMYLYMGDYPKTVTYANLANPTVIAQRADLTGLWQDTNTVGVLFRIPNLPGAGNLNRQIGVTWGQGGIASNVPEYAVRHEFWQLFQATDIRTTAFIQTVTSGGINFRGIRKLFGKPGQNNGIVDYKILRAEEALLNKAEAEYYTGGDALGTLDLLRSQRYSSFASPGETGVNLLNAIKLERRLEFAFEFHRFFDLKRWNEPIVRQATGDRLGGTGQQNPANALVLPVGDNRLQWPFSTQMITRNPNLDQNPGY